MKNTILIGFRKFKVHSFIKYYVFIRPFHIPPPKNLHLYMCTCTLKNATFLFSIHLTEVITCASDVYLFSCIHISKMHPWKVLFIHIPLAAFTIFCFLHFSSLYLNVSVHYSLTNFFPSSFSSPQETPES